MPAPARHLLKRIVGFDRTTIQKIEDWRARQKPIPTVSEAIRRLVEMGLASAHPAVRHGRRTAAKGSELAGKTIDWLSDQSASAEEQATRKRRLIKGPSEFREMRDDLRKLKG
jgi:hypothetical protein